MQYKNNTYATAMLPSIPFAGSWSICGGTDEETTARVEFTGNLAVTGIGQ